MNLIEAVRNLSLGFSIALLLPLTLYWGVQIFIPSPNLTSLVDKVIKKDISKLEESYDITLSQQEPKDEQQVQEYRKEYRKIQEKREQLEREYEVLRDRYQALYFYVSVIIGLFAIILGGLLGIPFLDLGLVLGGVLCLMQGYITNWSQLNTIIKFISLLLALILIFMFSFRIAKRERL